MRFSSALKLKSEIGTLDYSFEELIKRFSTKTGGSEFLAFKEAIKIKSAFKEFLYDMQSNISNYKEILEYFLNNCLTDTVYHFILLVADSNNINFRDSFKEAILSFDDDDLLFEAMLYTVNRYRIKKHFLFCLRPLIMKEKTKYTYSVPKSDEKINPILELGMDIAALGVKKMFWGIQDGIVSAIETNKKSSESLKDNYYYLELFIYISDMFVEYCDILYIDDKGNFEDRDGLEMTDGEFIKNKILTIDAIPKSLLNRSKINSLFKTFLEDTYFQIQLFETNKKIGAKYYRVSFFDDIVYERIASYIKNSDKFEYFCNILLKMSLLDPKLLDIEDEEEVEYYIDYKINFIQQSLLSNSSNLEKEILKKSKNNNQIIQYYFDTWKDEFKIQKEWNKVKMKALSKFN